MKSPFRPRRMVLTSGALAAGALFALGAQAANCADGSIAMFVYAKGEVCPDGRPPAGSARPAPAPSPSPSPQAGNVQPSCGLDIPIYHGGGIWTCPSAPASSPAPVPWPSPAPTPAVRTGDGAPDCGHEIPIYHGGGAWTCPSAPAQPPAPSPAPSPGPVPGAAPASAAAQCAIERSLLDSLIRQSYEAQFGRAAEADEAAWWRSQCKVGFTGQTFYRALLETHLKFTDQNPSVATALAQQILFTVYAKEIRQYPGVAAQVQNPASDAVTAIVRLVHQHAAGGGYSNITSALSAPGPRNRFWGQFLAADVNGVPQPPKLRPQDCPELVGLWRADPGLFLQLNGDGTAVWGNRLNERRGHWACRLNNTAGFDNIGVGPGTLINDTTLLTGAPYPVQWHRY